METCKALFIASEATPFVKTGGLADVAGTLPAALNKAGAHCALMLPLYSSIPAEYTKSAELLADFAVQLGWRTQICSLYTTIYDNVRVYFIGSDYYFNRPYIYGDSYNDSERFSFFCKAVLESLPHLLEFPDVLHLNDWHTGMIPLLLKRTYSKNPSYSRLKTLFTIHNLRYQGLFSIDSIVDFLSIGGDDLSANGIEFYGSASFMKAGIVFSDKVSTVSETYAKEILSPMFGEGLDGVLRNCQNGVSGIMNGIDTVSFNPRNDPDIAANFTADHPKGKSECKRALQKEMGLQQTLDLPLIGIVSRLTDQKGFRLIQEQMQGILSLGVQLAILGTGDSGLQEYFTYIANENPRNVSYFCGYSDKLARRIYAGSDLFLMPSQFEPCGISQLIAMRYGSLPIVRETGGLKDSVEPYNRYTRQGTGFTFTYFNANDMFNAILRAVECFHDKAAFSAVTRNAMDRCHDWSVSAKRYLILYSDLLESGGKSL